VTVEPTTQSRWFVAGCLMTCLATVLLIAVVWLPLLAGIDAWLFPLICALTALMGIGATTAIFSIRKD
jgi:hypothetical protein